MSPPLHRQALSVALGDLPQLINQVYNSLANIGVVPAAPTLRPQPAVSIKKSIQPATR